MADRRRSAVLQNAPAFAALGDETRLQLIVRLCEGGPMSIVRLTEDSDVSRQAVSKHLRALEEAGLIRGKRHGREHVWELKTARLTEIRHCLDRISGQWDRALERLRNLVETDR